MNGTSYLNSSIIAIDDIGVDDSNALLCYTNLTGCCSAIRMGQWYYPDSNAVGLVGDNEGFYRNRGRRVVRLNRRLGVTRPTGVYCCEITMDERYCIGLYNRESGKNNRV